ncbi:MAG: ComEC/Rec2 family competence protein [Syntrophomonas sp.]
MALVLMILFLSIMPTGCAYQVQNGKEVPNQSGIESGKSSGNEEQAASTGTGGQLKVHFIDVGQGDAILVQSPEGENMLIDAGDNDYGSQVVNYLHSQGVKSLDIVVGTHPHADHIGGMDTVINSFPIKNIYLPRITHSSRSFEDVLMAVKSKGLKIKTARAGIIIPLKGVQSTFMAPVGEKNEDLNNYSAVIKLNYGLKSFLLTGDAEHESENEMMASGADLKATVLKIGHHGSSSSTGYNFLKAAAPEYAIIMVGKDNPYGHPHQETISRLSAAGIKILRTDQNGTIVISTDGKNIDIKTVH